ncbi:MAG: CSN-associated deubiquitinating enzyme Ubp12 [Sclerophora amabilis]|nr:MAG: CSN-associated deubiquitinating enzyme Ubp12 [Sclerophora amabilis]
MGDRQGADMSFLNDRVERSEMTGDEDSRGLLPRAGQSPRTVTMEDGDASPLRSSSPAIKRPASHLDEGMEAAPEDVDMAQGAEELESEPTANATGPRRTSVSSPPASLGTTDQPRQSSLHESSRNEQATSEQTGSTTSENAVTPNSMSDMTTGATTPNLASDSSTRAGSKMIDTSDPTDSPIEAAPSLDEQIAKVKALSTATLHDGQEGFVVSYSWLQRVNSRSSDSKKQAKGDREAEDGEIGPLDNRDIVAEGDPSSNLQDEKGKSFIALRPGLTMGDDYDIFPREAWEYMIRWHGIKAHSPDIIRYVHDTNPDGDLQNLQYETYPPIFAVLKLRNDSAGFETQTLKDSQVPPLKVAASRSENFNAFLTRTKTMAGIPLHTKVRVWRILNENRAGKSSGMITPAASRSASPAPRSTPASSVKDLSKKYLIDVNTFLSLEDGSQRELIDVQDQTANEKYNGHMTLALAGLSQDESIVLEERIGGPGGGEWVSDAAGKTASRNGVPISVTKSGVTNVQNKAKPKISTSGRSSPAPAATGIMTRGRAQRSGRTLGTCGLSNLGNTCYMNSALQCVRSVEELTQYFRLDKYEDELNPSNPLSHNGDVAKSYASLLSQMYAANSPASVAPRNFKHTIGRYGPSFSGYGQQDSQEFLGFLLDGLQEDLNRIQKKPYIEKPDSTDEMVHDAAALRELADKCWGIYKARNDSVIADLFAGTYKSTLVCPECEKVSITFDPFNNLTLQLPIENVWSHQIFFFGLNEPPIRLDVDMDKNGSIKSLKEYVATRTKKDIQKLHAVELYKCKIYKVYEDYATVSESIQSSDDVGIFELEDVPTNFPSPKRKQQKVRSMLNYWSQPDEDEDVPSWDSPLAAKMLVPIFHRSVRDGATRFSSNALFAIPQFIVVNQDEARDYDAILRKILARIDTMTTLDLFQSGEDSDQASTAQDDDDMVVTTSEDADSSAGGKVKTHSIDGEDDFVDVSMRDVGESGTATATQSEGPEQPTENSRVLGSIGPIPDRLRNLFQVRTFQQAGELIPTGWNTYLEDNKDLVDMDSRIPQSPFETSLPETRADRYAMPGNDNSSDSADELDNPPEQINNHISPRESDSESNSEDLPSARSMLSQPVKLSRRSKVRSGKGSRYNKGRMKHTYSRKDRYSVEPTSNEDTDSGPLIRLGEGLLLDWSPQAHAALFTGLGSTDEMRGAPTWENVDILPDAELKQKRALRQSRRKKGVSLSDCLDEFGKDEILSEADAWYCPRCKEHRRASKKFELWKSPDILIIHLKRFSASRGLRDKLDVLVDFPIEGLDLRERVAMEEDGKSNIYDLFAVDNHFGGLGGGHYTAFAQNFIDKNWYDYNDTMVSKRSPDHAVSTAAYLLFYRRRSDRPLGGPTFEKIIDEANLGSESASSSRAGSPAGDGQRLGDHSRSGSPSDSQEAGVRAPHQQRGTGGSAGGGPRLETMKDDDDLPAYSDDNVPEYETDRRYDPGLGTETTSQEDSMGFGQAWSFPENLQHLNQMSAVPPGSDDDENLMDDASDKAAVGSESGNMSDPDNRMADFDDFEDDGVGGFSEARGVTAPGFSSRDSSPARPVEDDIFETAAELQVKAPVAVDDEDDEVPVAEVHVEEGEGIVAKSE